MGKRVERVAGDIETVPVLSSIDLARIIKPHQQYESINGSHLGGKKSVRDENEQAGKKSKVFAGGGDNQLHQQRESLSAAS